MKLNPLTTAVLGFVVTLPGFWLAIPKLSDQKVEANIEESYPLEFRITYKNLPEEKDAVRFLLARYDIFQPSENEEDQTPRREKLDQLLQLHNMELALRDKSHSWAYENRIGHACRNTVNDLWELAAYQSNEGDLQTAEKTLKLAHKVERFGLNFPFFFNYTYPSVTTYSAPFLEVLSQQAQSPETLQLFLKEAQSRPRLELSEAFIVDARRRSKLASKDVDKDLSVAKNLLKIAEAVKDTHLETDEYFRSIENLKVELDLVPNSAPGIYEQNFRDHWFHENRHQAIKSALLDALNQPPAEDLFTKGRPYQVRKDNGKTRIWSVGFDLIDNNGDRDEDHCLTFTTIQLKGAP